MWLNHVYSKCFGRGIQAYDVVSWITLIEVYVELELGEEMVHCFFQIQREGIFFNVASYNALIVGCVESIQQEYPYIYGHMQGQGLLPNQTTYFLPIHLNDW